MLLSYFSQNHDSHHKQVKCNDRFEQVTIHIFQWEIPEAKLVNTCAIYTQAEAVAGGIPIPNKMELLLTP